MLIGLLSILAAAPAHSESKWGLGIGGVAQDNGYVDLGSEVNLLPVFYYEVGDFYLLGPQFGYEFGSLSNFEFSLVGGIRFDGYEAEDADVFEGMEDRSGSIDIGLEIEYESDYGDFSFEYLADAGSEHKGNEISFKYSLPFIFESSVITPFISVTHQSEDLVDYYYGVRDSEVTDNRALYKGEATSNVEFGIDSTWMFGKHHRVVGNLSYAMLGDEIKDSPLVENSNSLSLVFGYLYVF
ncbi:MipA/OmpV family protein [Alteromonas stellipolaris]|uniref:MipA/OmpV family protein n=1 Tax=Alteromonas stellipolaris TaxID=233316 RepID=UPI00249496EB|nr:MipA/OmpV family protein [Alteromonas stellipolaris]